MVKRLYQAEKHKDILKEFEDMFVRLGCLPGKHQIQINTEVRPVVHAPRRIQVVLREKVIKELKRMEQMGDWNRLQNKLSLVIG